MTPLERQHVDAALHVMRQHGSICAMLADTMAAVFTGIPDEFRVIGSINVDGDSNATGFAPQGLGKWGWVGVQEQFIDQYYNSEHARLSDWGSTQKFTSLVNILAHEANHLLNTSAPGYNQSNHNSNGETPNQWNCGS